MFTTEFEKTAIRMVDPTKPMHSWLDKEDHRMVQSWPKNKQKKFINRLMKEHKKYGLDELDVVEHLMDLEEE